MAHPFIRVPLRRLNRPGCDIIRIDLDLDVQGEGSRYYRLPFRVDSASDFTTIPISMAASLNIPFATDCPVYPHTAAGKAQKPSYLSPIAFVFPGLAQLRFERLAIFSPYALKTSLLSIGDLVPNFVIRFPVSTMGFPDGCAVLQLRPHHQGSTRHS